MSPRLLRPFVLGFSLATLCSVLSLRFATPAVAADLLWQIGKPDDSNAEFALAPKDYHRYERDGFFVVGQSDPKRDWPYVHPGPGDGWAGGRHHTFTIVFGLKQPGATGDCRLKFGLLDTHSQGPPELSIDINGLRFSRKLPPGKSDASVQGQPDQGKHHDFEIVFPATQLQAGQNAITITTETGSWFLYDWVGLETPTPLELAATQSTVVSGLRAVPALIEQGSKLVRPISGQILHFGEAASARVALDGKSVAEMTLKPGENTFEVRISEVDRETTTKVTVEVAGKVLSTRQLTLKPVRKLTVYILPHSHTDIGYTEIQTEIEDKQVQNLLQGIAYARKTANYPVGARFVWNVEVAWAADLYLRRLDNARKEEFLQAVKQGQVSLQGMYLNELTGLCRPEELLRLFRFATELGEKTGVPIDSAMISDVPGYTWGTVTAMAQAGVKYFSTAPNYFDRIGDILQQWENKPFYWLAPDGKSKVLVWIPYRGYAMSHIIGQLTPGFVTEYQQQLEKTAYPYDIAYMRWSGHGDNAVPDPVICEFVKEWDTHYAWPKFIISSTSEAFSAFEKRYGQQLPQVRGDWTPYWEDGAGSSALETTLNRASSDRLSQAESVWATLNAKGYPKSAFVDAWRDVLLYSEHTWGAWCSISEPFRRETREQWAIKQSYAVSADRESRELLSRGLANEPGPAVSDAVDIFNTTSWSRTELVVVPKFLSEGRNRVTDDTGAPVPSQRLRTGELVVLAQNIPPFAARRFQLGVGNPQPGAGVTAQGATLKNDLLTVRVDEETGAIVELRMRGLDANLADTSGGEGLNDYKYFTGENPAEAKRNGKVRIAAVEPGPLVATLRIESEAPGCHRFWREISLVAGQDFVLLDNTLDKARLLASSYHAREGKESLNFAFPFAVPDGQVRIEVPFGVLKPDEDQIPSACKNWFTAGRWADVANAQYGVTWVTLDAPLVQVGGLTANLLNSQSNPDVWRKKVGPTQKLYSWAMNNHWGTNYRAYQEGPHTFRFILRPHMAYEPAAASRLAIAAGQPLLPTVARGAHAPSTSRVTVSGDGVLATGFKPADDGKGLILRLWGAGGRDAQAEVSWAKPGPRRMWLSDTSERPLKPVSGSVVNVPAWGVVTLRAE